MANINNNYSNQMLDKVNEWNKHMNKPVKVDVHDGTTYQGILNHIDQENIYIIIPIQAVIEREDTDTRAFGYGAGYPGTTGYGAGVPGGYGGGYGDYDYDDVGYPGTAGYGAGYPGTAGYGAGYPGTAGYGAGYPGTAGYGAGYPGTAGYGAGYPGAAGYGMGYPGAGGYGRLTLPLAVLKAISAL